jgi:predicted PurR-regulated permease PerM
MRLVKVSVTFIALCLLFYVLLVGKNLLIPLVLAIFIWFLINMLKDLIGMLSIRGKHLPQLLCFIFAIIGILLAFAFIIDIISSNVAAVSASSQTYTENFSHILNAASAKVAEWFKLENPPRFNDMLKDFDFGSLLSKIAMGLTSLAGRTGIVLIYILFLFLEQASFSIKFKALCKDRQQQEQLTRIVNRIQKDVRTYFGIKVFTSALTGFLSYLIMKWVGLDFAEFWGLLIFLMNFIPTIGSIIATVFPALLALVQFPTFGPFFIIVGGIGMLQFLIGNLLEPKMMGNTLNMSPLVILLALAFWGAIWGIPGMILSVPITVISIIICANFPATRPFAILLSKDGRVSAEN